MLTDTDIKKMQGLYIKHFGIELDKDEARLKLSMLVRQMELVYVPITAEQLKAFQDENQRPVPESNDDEHASSK